ncbi:hypothetical protein ACNO6Z_10730 [Aliarcobacter lanthieri]|uniref:hypothetical protein n=2 Tax=Aliarcobacter lanthieri TaxID=1355374 RepID=UPI003AA95792
MTKNSILERYDKDENGNLIIRIHTPKVEDLYENYDKKSTFIKKDLKEDLEDYLIESVEEIDNNPFKIVFYFDEKSTSATEDRLKISIKEYFEYLQYLKKIKIKESIKNSLIFIVIGFILVAFAFILSENEDFIIKLLSEGIMVGGWVALWEAGAILLINWIPLKKELNIFKKISNANIECY